MLELVLGVVGTIASTFARALVVGSDIFLKVATALTEFANALGVIDEKDPERLGDKIIQAEEEGIKPEKYEKYEDYMKAIGEFEIDEEKSKEIDKNEKLLRGTDAAAKVIESKFPEHDVAGFMTSVALSDENKKYFASDSFKEILNEVKDNPDVIDSLSKLLQGKDMSEQEYYDVIDRLSTIEKRLDPSKSESEIAERLRSLG